MANTPQAKKRIRRNDRRAEINGARVSRIRTFVKQVEAALASGDKAPEPPPHAVRKTTTSADESTVATRRAPRGAGLVSATQISRAAPCRFTMRREPSSNSSSRTPPSCLMRSCAVPLPSLLVSPHRLWPVWRRSSMKIE